MLAPMITAGAMPGMVAPSMVAAPAATSVIPAPPQAGMNAFAPAVMGAAPAATSAISVATPAVTAAAAPLVSRATKIPSSAITTAAGRVARTTNTPTAKSAIPTPDNAFTHSQRAGSMDRAALSAAELQHMFTDTETEAMAEGTALGLASGLGAKLFMADGFGRIGAHAIRLGPGNIGKRNSGSMWDTFGRSARSVADTANASLWALQDTSLNNIRALPATFFKTALYGPERGGIGHANDGPALNTTEKYQHTGLAKHSANGWFTKRMQGWEKALTPAVTDAAPKTSGFWGGIAETVGNALQPYGNWRAGHKEAAAAKQHTQASARLEKLFTKSEAAIWKQTGAYHNLHTLKTELAKGVGNHDEKAVARARNGVHAALGTPKENSSFLQRKLLARQFKGIEASFDSYTRANSAAKGFANIADSVRKIPSNIGDISLLDGGIRAGMGLEAAVHVKGVATHISHAMTNFKNLIADVEGISPRSVNASAIILGEARHMVTGSTSSRSPVVQQAAREMLATYGPEAISAAVSTWSGARIMRRGFAMLPMFIDMAGRQLASIGAGTTHMLNAYEALSAKEKAGEQVTAEEIAYLISAASAEAAVAGPDRTLVHTLAEALQAEGKSVLGIVQLVNDKPAFLARAEKVQSRLEAEAAAELAEYQAAHATKDKITAERPTAAAINEAPSTQVTAGELQQRVNAPATSAEVVA